MGVWVSQHGAALHRMLLLRQAQKQGVADAFPHHCEGPPGELSARHRPTCSLPDNFTPAHLGTNIFILTGYIGGQVWEKGSAGRCGRMQELAGGRRWGEGIRG